MNTTPSEIRPAGTPRSIYLLLAGLIVMLGSALTGREQIFGYSVVAVLGWFIVLGLFRRRSPVTWIPAFLAIGALLVSMAGMFATQGTTITAVSDTVGGFHPGTAFLIYGLWIPAFLTLALGSVLVFEHLAEEAPKNGGTKQ